MLSSSRALLPLNIHHFFHSQTSSKFSHSQTSYFVVYFSIIIKMLPNFMNPFKVESQEVKQRRKHVMSSIESTTMDVGLRLLPQITSSKGKSNILIKSAVKMENQTIPIDFCFLKTCNLCNKQLSPNKDIYMYRYILTN